MASWKDDLNITVFSTDLNYQFDAFDFKEEYEDQSYYFWVSMNGTSFKRYIDMITLFSSYDVEIPEFMLKILYNENAFYSYCTLVELSIDPPGITHAKFKVNYLSLHSWNDRLEELCKDKFDVTTRQRSKAPLPTIVNVWYNNPYTTVVWSDDTITKAKCRDNEMFDKETGLSICISKKYFQYVGYSTFAKALKDTSNKSVDVPRRKLHKLAKKLKAKTTFVSE